MVACLKKHKGTAQTSRAVSELAQALGCRIATARKYLAATAEQLARAQADHLHNTCLYAASLTSVGSFRSLCFIEFQAYDESPLRVRVNWDGSARAPNQVAKVFVALTQWALVLQKTASSIAAEEPEFLVLHGVLSPAVRAADSTSARGVAAVIANTPRPANVAKEFLEGAWVIRVAESDGLAANAKAERLLFRAEQNTHLHIECMAHRVHSIADRVWELDKATLSGVVHCLLTMRSSGQMLALEKALVHVLEQRLVIDQSSERMTDDAMHFRRGVLQCFLPQPRSPRKRTVCLLLAGMLNADWRVTSRITHQCQQGCCNNKEESLSKIKDLLHRVMRSLRPSRLCRANWQEWHKPMCVLGLLGSMHNLLAEAFELSMTNSPVEPYPEVYY